MYEVFGNRVLVRWMGSKKTAGRLYVTAPENEPVWRGEVLAVGPGRWLECGKLVEPPVLVGSVVLFPRLACTHVGPIDDTMMIVDVPVLLAAEPSE